MWTLKTLPSIHPPVDLPQKQTKRVKDVKSNGVVTRPKLQFGLHQKIISIGL